MQVPLSCLVVVLCVNNTEEKGEYILIWLYILIGIILFVLLTYLDYYFGKYQHEKHVENQFYPIKTGDYKLYQTGQRLFNDMFQEIKDARSEVFIQSFIVKKDETSKQLLSLLKEKAREGVTVRLLIDRLGGFRILVKDRLALKQAGVHFSFSSKPGFPFFFYRLHRRNHRKIAVIDGKIGYVGGFNIADEYKSMSPTFSNWRDYHLRLTGQVVEDLQKVFQFDWEKATKTPIDAVKTSLPKQKKEAQIIATDGYGLEDMFFQFINHAEKEIIIGSPYFIPSDTIIQALEKAIEKEVQVKLLIPMKADHPFVKEAGIPYYKRLKEKGADVRLFDQGFYHGKLFIVDDRICDIGTANFDRRSFYLNKEVNVITYDKDFIMKVRSAYMKDFEESIECDEKWLHQLGFWTKLKMPIAKLFRPFL
jgi:cardiolipin synthase A/B